MYRLVFVFFILMSTQLTFAQSGQIGSAGGDLCEDRFKVIAQNLEVWIQSGNTDDLKLPAKVSRATYAEKMSREIKKARITCVGPGDKGYPVTVNHRAKECKNFVDQSGVSRIVCDRNKFYAGLAHPENDPEQYKIVHHEYASLARLEIPNQDDSHYEISDQITGFLVDEVVKRLPVEPSARPEGKYSGIAFLEKDGTAIAFELDLSESTSQSTQALSAQLILQMPSGAVAVNQSGVKFDATSGSLKIVIPASRYENGRSVSYVINLLGNLNGRTGTMTGVLEVEGYSGYGLKFKLARSGESLAVISAQIPASSRLIPSATNYSGQTHFVNGVTMGVTLPVNLTLNEIASTSTEQLLAFLLPVKFLLATLNYGEGAMINFNSALWDQRTGRLSGEGQLASAPVPTVGSSLTSSRTPFDSVELNCNYIATTHSFDCQHSTSRSAGTAVAETVVTATSNPHPDLGFDPTLNEEVRFTYRGTGNFPDPFHPEQLRKAPVTLTVLYPSRTNQQYLGDQFFPDSEEIVVLSFTIDGMSGASFNSVKFSKPTHALNGFQSYTVSGGEVATQSISCQNFEFHDPNEKYHFNCVFNNTFNNLTTSLELVN